MSDGRPGLAPGASESGPGRSGPRRLAGPAVTAGPLLLALLGAGLAVPASAEGQLRRDPSIPYVPDAAGSLLLGVGGGLSLDRDFPLSGLEGDLGRLGAVTVTYSFAPGAVVHVQGDAYRILSVDRRRPGEIELDPGVEDGTTQDAGDFTVATLFRLLGRPEGLSGGLHLAVELPNSDETKGIGTNTTNFLGAGFGSWRRGPVRLVGELGIGILEAPVEDFEQNDVVVYAAEVLWNPRSGRPGEGPWLVSLEAAGRASTRGRVPPGTEDLGLLELGGHYRRGGWLLDGAVSVGYAGNSPDLGFEVGLSRVLEPGRASP